MMKTHVLAGLAMIGLAACGKAKSQSAADSTRSIELVRGDSTYRLNDSPSTVPAPAPAATPAPRPASRSLTLASGVRIDATTEGTISSRTDKAGDTFTANVSSDVKDGRGRVVIPAGSTVNLTVTELKPAFDKGKADGRITVMVNSVTVGSQTYPVSASITSMEHTLKGRGVGAAEVEKTAAGAAIGGIAGRIIGGNAKGTVIGAVVGGAAGAAIAVQTANRDVVVAAGTPMVITLNGPVTITLK